MFFLLILKSAKFINIRLEIFKQKIFFAKNLKNKQINIEKKSINQSWYKKYLKFHKICQILPMFYSRF